MYVLIIIEIIIEGLGCPANRPDQGIKKSKTPAPPSTAGAAATIMPLQRRRGPQAAAEEASGQTICSRWRAAQ